MSENLPSLVTMETTVCSSTPASRQWLLKTPKGSKKSHSQYCICLRCAQAQVHMTSDESVKWLKYTGLWSSYEEPLDKRTNILLGMSQAAAEQTTPYCFSKQSLSTSFVDTIGCLPEE